MFKLASTGSVLIEFAFCVPVLIVLLFFVNDHYRFYELRNKVKNSAYMMANMIQNICNDGKVDHITSRQIKQIAFASCLNLFNNNSMFKPYPHGVAFAGKIVYVKRNSEDSYYSHTYTFTTETDTATTAPLADRVSCEINGPNTLTTAQVMELDSGLVCDKEGEEKLLIQVSYEPTEDNKADSASKERGIAAIASGGKSVLPKISLAARKLRLILLPAKSGNFTYAMVINPKPGSFQAARIETRKNVSETEKTLYIYREWGYMSLSYKKLFSLQTEMLDRINALRTDGAYGMSFSDSELRITKSPELTGYGVRSYIIVSKDKAYVAISYFEQWYNVIIQDAYDGTESYTVE